MFFRKDNRKKKRNPVSETKRSRYNKTKWRPIPVCYTVFFILSLCAEYFLGLCFYYLCVWRMCVSLCVRVPMEAREELELQVFVSSQTWLLGFWSSYHSKKTFLTTKPPLLSHKKYFYLRICIRVYA